MTVAAQARFLHVANGTSTTGTIEAAGIPGIRSIWADPLYEGPVPAGLDDEELLDLRARFLAPQGAPHDPGNDLREWRDAIERHESYGELVLWFEHDLFDQLNLIQLLTWIRDRLPETKPVSLICIGSFPGRPRFKGLGELSPAELASLLDTRQPLGGAQYDLARRAWQAFREPAPLALDELRRADTPALPYLGAAITRFLQEYPWTRDGLSRSERRLLELARGEGMLLRMAFPKMHDGEDTYYITDSSLADLAAGLSRTVPPLLSFDRSVTEAGHILRGRVSLTDAGRAVLGSERDRIALCGIDRWLGGVHLENDNRIWRWDPARQHIA
jgi:hypothetical protein